MSARRINFALWAATIVLSAAAVAAVVTGLLSPLDISAEQESSISTTSDRPPKSSAGATTELAALDRPLRLPLTDAAPAPALQAVAGSAPMANSTPLVLVGTIGDSLAMFRMPNGSISLQGIGDQIDGAEVIAIRPAQVEVLLNGKRTIIEKAKSASPTTAEVQTDLGP